MNIQTFQFEKAAMPPDAANTVEAQEVDPIYAAITAHQIAYHEHCAAVTLQSLLEGALPEHDRKSFITAFDRKIFKTDDPRWIACVRKVDKASDVMDAAAQAMVNIKPTTLPGIVALLRYVAEHAEDGNVWPDYAANESDEVERGWTTQLHLTLAEAVEKIGGEVNADEQKSRH